MWDYINEQERGTVTGRSHPRNGYYALTGPLVRVSGQLKTSRRLRPTITGSYEPRLDLPSSA